MADYEGTNTGIFRCTAIMRIEGPILEFYGYSSELHELSLQDYPNCLLPCFAETSGKLGSYEEAIQWIDKYCADKAVLHRQNYVIFAVKKRMKKNVEKSSIDIFRKINYSIKT